MLECMVEGERARITVPPESGFGEFGIRNNSTVIVPANSTLQYDVEVVCIDDSQIDAFTGSNNDKLLEAARQRRVANEFYKSGKLKRAYQRYISCLSYLEDAFDLNDIDDLTEEERRRSEGPPGIGDFNGVKLEGDKATTSNTDEDPSPEIILAAKAEQKAVLSNLASTALKMEQYTNAIAKWNRVLKMFPSDIKMLYTRGKASTYFGDYESAGECVSIVSIYILWTSTYI